MYSNIFDGYDLNELIKRTCGHKENVLKEIIAYHLYREFHIDTKTYMLSKNSYQAYTSLIHRLLRAKCQPIGTRAVRHRLYQGLILINKTDVIVHLYNENVEGELNELSIEDHRYLSLE